MNQKQKKHEKKQQRHLNKAKKRFEILSAQKVKRQSAYPIFFKGDDTRIPHLESLMNKHNNGELMTEKEVEYFCNSLYREIKHNYKICDDYRFYELYLDHVALKHNIPFSEDYREFTMNRHYNREANQRREIALDEFYETWKRKIYAQEQTNDQVYMEIRKETKEMIKKMRENHEARGFSEEDIYESEREIIWRSKAVYVKANKIIKDIGRSIYSLTFCGNELHIDVFSLIHILFRHYAELTKPHNDNKSHFSEIPPELLMESLYNILLKIEKSGHLKTDDMPVDIFFEYYRQLYRIYFKKVKKSEKNRGLYEIYRVNTWYPVEAEKDIKDAENLTAKKVGKWLDVWI